MAWKNLGDQRFRLKCDLTEKTAEGTKQELRDKGWTWGKDVVNGDRQRWAVSPSIADDERRDYISNKIAKHQNQITK